jgi:hypothetical protein
MWIIHAFKCQYRKNLTWKVIAIDGELHGDAGSVRRRRKKRMRRGMRGGEEKGKRRRRGGRRRNGGRAY